MKNISNILLLGGTGAMGTNLVKVLGKQDGSHVVVTSRQKHKDTESIEYRQGDAHDTDWLHNILAERRWDAIVDFMVYTTDEFKQRASLLLNATKQYVFISSARVYADSGNNLITEESPRLLDVCQDKEYLQTDEYALTKARQENILINNQQKNWTIIRPYITFSDNRLQLGVMEKENWLIPALNNRPIVFSKDIAEHYTTMTDGVIVAKGIAALLTQPEAKSEIFNIATHNSYLWKDILQWYIEVYREVKGVEPLVYLTDKWDGTFGGGIYQWKYDRLFNRRFDNKKISKFIPEKEFEKTEISLKNAMRKFIESYNPQISDLNQSAEFKRGVLTGRFLPLSYVKGKKRILKTIAYKLHIAKQLKLIHNIWKH